MASADGIWHGGDLASARALFPEAPEPWVDLSTGISPHPYPLPALPLSAWTRLPGRAEEATLLAAARIAYGVPPETGIVAAPGTQILIELLPRLQPAGPVAVLGPTYGEHALSWRKAGCEVREIVSPEAAGDAATLVVVNPNNPDGHLLDRDVLMALAARCRARGGLLVVDEAFVDFMPQASLIPVLPEGTVVLRSFGKTYGLAGVRLGFAVAAADLTSRLGEALGPWAVAGPALAIGAAALSDDNWLAGQATARAADRVRIEALLASLGRVVGGTSLFVLLETPEAPGLFAALGRAGIYVRRFSADPRRLRFGLPGDDAEWRRLEHALAAARPAQAPHASPGGTGAAAPA